jgi:Family of unknown function (DUF5706)
MPPNDPDQQTLAIDFAWRTHDSIQQWTRNVDQKSSIVLAFVTAVGALLAREALSADGGLADATGVRLWLIRIAAASLFGAAFSALAAITPKLRSRNVRPEAPRGLIFFGHLRYRGSSTEIAKAYTGLTAGEVLDQLARQNKETSKIAWDKHRSLQLAITLLVTGVVTFALARLT